MRTATLIKALLVAATPAIFPGCADPHRDPSEFLTYQVSANTDHTAFVHNLPSGEPVVVIAPNNASSVKTFRATPGNALRSTMLLETTSFFVTVTPRINPPYSPEGLQSLLYRCESETGACEQVFKTGTSIVTPIPLPNEAVLYAGSPPTASPRGFPARPKLAYGHSDLYLFADGRARKLTDIDAYEIGSISRVGDRVVFNARPRRKHSKPRPKSHIYCGELRVSADAISVTPQMQRPCVEYGGSYDELPNLSSDGRLVAFRSAAGPASTWVFNIVVLRWDDKKLMATIAPIEGHPRSLSKPVFIDERHIRYVERRDDQKLYNLWDYDIVEQQGRIASTISDQQIEAQKPVIVGD
jgi:hypothetical protein